MKKLFNRITALALCLIMLVPTVAFGAARKTTSVYTNKTYTHNARYNSNYEIMQGIDVSKHNGYNNGDSNGHLDWKKIKSAGTEFVIVRAGFRGYGESGTLVKDERFDEYIKAAKDNGLLVGAYIYSQAITVSEAEKEADFILNIVNGYEIDLPIVFDYEFADVSDGRLDRRWNNGTLNKEKMTNNALAFCNKIAAAGYQPMVYANKSFLNDQLDHQKLEDAGIKIWLAHYVGSDLSTDYKGNYDMWQYSDKGVASGVKGVFDVNFMYVKKAPATAPAPITVDPVKNAVATNTRANSTRLKWDEVKNANIYVIKKYKSSGYVEIGRTTSTSYDVTGLSSSCNYAFKIVACNINAGEYTYSKDSKVVRTTTTPLKPTLTSSSKVDKITLKWKAQPRASGYRLYRVSKKTGKYYLDKEIVGGDKSSVTVTDVNPNTDNKFKIVAYKTLSDGTELLGEYSAPKVCYTCPRTPIFASVANTSTQKITVKWNKTSQVTNYQIQWSTLQDFSSNKKTVTTDLNARSTVLKTASKNRNYYVRVRSYVLRPDGKKYYSAWSETKKIYVK